MRILQFLAAAVSCCAAAQNVPLEIAPGIGPEIAVAADEASLTVNWQDEAGRDWSAVFRRAPDKAPIAAAYADGRVVLRDARPFYRAETGKRRKGWNAFFDYPPAHPEGTQAWQGRLDLQSIRVESAGNRVRVVLGGFRMGVFSGDLVYTFFPGSRLIRQEAALSTDVPDTAYFYDAGLAFAAPEHLRPGKNMDTRFAWYDTEGTLQSSSANGLQPERIPYKVRYRALAAAASSGGVAAFPAPHRYFFPRDFTSNLGHNWLRSWRGEVSLGIRQIGDTNWRFYPWMNAPAGSVQRMGMFLLLSADGPEAALEDALRYTNRDRFPALDGYKTLTAHWHLAYTVQALEKGLDWTPPFKTVLQEMGVDAAIIMDFHGDGHPRDLTELRLQELDSFFQACRAQSDDEFLLIPSEEANVHLGGHWALVFPQPVYWWMDRPPGGKFASVHKKYGTVYSAANAAEMLDLVRRENGWMYQTHARTKGSTGYPDAIRETEHFRDPRYFGAGWKAMPSDPSSPRLGERALTLLDDMRNWGLDKQVLGEVDVFQFDHTHELYAHMNVNYVRADRLPAFDEYGRLLEPLLRGEMFVSTGEVLLPEWEISGSADEIRASAKVRWTFPLNFAEIVWGDGESTHRERIDLRATGSFSEREFQWTRRAPGWKWARLAVWDAAANGAFVNPVRRPE